MLTILLKSKNTLRKEELKFDEEGFMKFSNYHCRPTLWPTLITIVMLIILITLGVWQLHRYHYKQWLLNQYEEHLQANPVPFDAFLNIKDQKQRYFRHVQLTGRYLNQYTMLLENRFSHGKTGVDVLTPLQVADQNKILLVDRGFIEQLPNQPLKSIPAIIGEQQVVGFIQILDHQGFILGPAILNSKIAPYTLQRIDFQALESLFPLHFYPFMLRLDANQPHGFIREWQPLSVKPERHLGYAIQWFAMALAMLIAFFAFSSRKKELQ